MSPTFAPDFKELVRSRTNLVELVGESVALKAKGGNDHVGLCPFHPDHNPSFHVYADRQSYRCWVCQEGGDCFSFLMKYEAIGFRDALELLARRAGLEMPKPERTAYSGGSSHSAGSSGRSSTGNSSRESEGESDSALAKPQLYDVVAWAEEQFHEALLKSPQGGDARRYLEERGFTQETITRCRLGYHPDDWNWLINRARGRFTPQQLVAARLVNQREASSHESSRSFYDCFVDRLIFPIRDERSRPVAFGGRILPGRDATNTGKYINSAEGPLFSKSKLIYALDVARDAIRKSDPPTALVVEGYVDCIMCQQHGLWNVVAPLGTALGESHVQILKRFAKRVVLVFDGDAAGRMAAERALPKFLAQDVDLRVLTIPEGSKDPDEYLQQHGAEAFRALMTQAPDVLDYKLSCAIGRYGIDSTGARELVLGEMLDLMAENRGLEGTQREHMICSRLVQRLLVPEETLRQELKRRRQQRERRAAARPVQSFEASPTVNNSRRDVVGRPSAAIPSSEFSPHEIASRGQAPRDGRRPLHANQDNPNQNNPSTSSPTTNPRPRRAIEFLQGQRTKSDLEECDVLEILMTAPEWATDICTHLSVSDFRNEHLRELAQVCYDIVEQGLEPSFATIVSALEDPELKRLAVAIDGMAREKNVSGLLQADRAHEAYERSTREHAGALAPSPAGLLEFGDQQAENGERTKRPSFLQQALNQMLWRRQEQSHQQSRLRIAQMENASGLDPQARALLERVTQFNARRAAKKPPAPAGMPGAQSSAQQRLLGQQAAGMSSKNSPGSVRTAETG